MRKFIDLDVNLLGRRKRQSTETKHERHQQREEQLPSSRTRYAVCTVVHPYCSIVVPAALEQFREWSIACGRSFPRRTKLNLLDRQGERKSKQIESSDVVTHSSVFISFQMNKRRRTLNEGTNKIGKKAVANRHSPVFNL